MTPVGEPSIYRIDGANRISFVNEPWLAFARANGATTLTPEAVLGRPVWDFIAGREVLHLYRALLQEVRRRHRALSLPFSCDAPALARAMELEVMPLPAGVIEFRSHLKAGVNRPPLPLLDAAAPRTDWYVSICSWCKGVEVTGGVWEATETAVRVLGLFGSSAMPRLMHTICPKCLTAIRSSANIEPGEPTA